MALLRTFGEHLAECHTLRKRKKKLQFCNFATIEKLIVVDTLVQALACVTGSAFAKPSTSPYPKKTNSYFSPKFNDIPWFSWAFQACATYNNKALTGHTMPGVSEQSWLFNTHTILVFLCRRAVVLMALLVYNGPHSGVSEWQQAERNHGARAVASSPTHT